jgi:hypothetical protein
MGVCPFADQSQRFDSSFPTQVYRGGPSKGVLHSTETSGWPGYANGSMAPHFTVRVYLAQRKVVIRQHFDTKRPSRALVDGPNPVQTNNDGTVQVELIGTCDKATAERSGLFYWPDAPTWVLDELAKLMRWIEADRGVKRKTTNRPWLPYPKSYGNANGQRMTIAEWDAFDGWCGHQHVPDGNDHGDPGDLNIGYLLNPQEDPFMALTDKQQMDLYNRVMGGIPSGSSIGRTGRLLDTDDGQTLRNDIGYIRDQILTATAPEKVAEVVKAAVTAGGSPDEIADAVVKQLGVRLNATTPKAGA